VVKAVSEALGIRFEGEEGGVWLGWEGSSRVAVAVYVSEYPVPEDVYSLVARLSAMPVEKAYVVVTRETLLLLDASVFRRSGVGLLLYDDGVVDVRVPARAREPLSAAQLPNIDEVVARVLEEVRRRVVPSVVDAVMAEVRRFVEERLREFRAEVLGQVRAGAAQAVQQVQRAEQRVAQEQGPRGIVDNVWVSVLRSRQ